jgi:molybdopterin-containing oxidoreductase family iron-sulfur binding subunit
MENNQPLGTWWNRILTVGGDYIDTPAGTYPDVQKYYEPVSCQHCENAPCVRVCPVGATYQRPDGLVLIDYDKCIGCRFCIAACPYGARAFNWRSPDYSATEGQPHGAKEVPVRPAGVTEKCTFCVHRLDQGKDPICVEVCPVQARMFGDLNDPNSQVAQVVRDGDAFRLREDLGTRPNVYYLPPKKSTRQRRGGYADLLTKAKLSTR